MRVDCDTVGDWQSGITSEFNIWNDSNPDDDQIRLLDIGKRAAIEYDIDAFGTVHAIKVLRNNRSNGARHQPRLHLDHFHRFAESSGRRRDFQPNESAPD